MAALSIRLLGAPRIERDGEALPGPRGNKAWALLAYLLLADAPTRSHLVSLLFAEAADPLAALRWNLSALRRLLGDVALEGDPVRLRLPGSTSADVLTLIRGSAGEAVGLDGVERDLLEGMSFASCPSFEIWLEGQRRHLGGAAEAVLHEAALERLGERDAAGATDLAGRLVAMNPFEENFQTLYVRCLAAAGDGIGAARQVARCSELFRRELGKEPSPALAAAAQTVTNRPTSAPVTGRAGARAQLDAGEAAIRAGAFDAGLNCLRRAVADARAIADHALEAEALLALGYALVHAARGRDEEAAAALHEALAVASRASLAGTAAAVCRELGYVEYLQGRYDRAQSWLERAARTAGDSASEQGRIACVLGAVLTDTSEYGPALEQLQRSLELCRREGDGRQAAYTLSMIGRAHLLCGRLDDAEIALIASLEGSRRENWTALAPWPESLRADVHLARGDVRSAVEGYENAFALGCHLEDPCWEGTAARGLGRVAAMRGEVAKAMEWFTEARTRSTRLPDAYRWVDAWTLESQCDVGVSYGLPGVRDWIAELSQTASRSGMRELAVRAYLHQGRLGDESALAAAELLAAEIDNPRLTADLAAVSSPRGRAASAS